MNRVKFQLFSRSFRYKLRRERLEHQTGNIEGVHIIMDGIMAFDTKGPSEYRVFTRSEKNYATTQILSSLCLPGSSMIKIVRRNLVEFSRRLPPISLPR